MAYRVSLPDTYAFEAGAAQGGAGILKAIHKETDRRFAVKSYRPPVWLTAREAEAYRDRVRATVERLACVDHPGLAPVFDVVEQDGWVHVLREFVPGVSLAARLTEHGPLPTWDVRYMASRVASAIDALAEAGMAHGSLGPRNIILAEDGSVVLTDAMLADVSRAFTIGARWARFQQRAGAGAGGDLRGLAVSTLQALTGCAATQARGAASAAYELAPSAREAFRRALQNDRRAFRSASEFAASLCPDSGLPLFQQVWRPAAAAGLLGALATVGGSATSDVANRAAREAASRRFVQIVPATVKVIVRPRIVLNDEDQQALRLAIRRHGAAILAHPAVAEVFKLTDAQKAEIDRCLSEQRAKVEQLVSGAADGKVLDTASPMSALRDQTQTRVLRVLNDTQRELWDETTSAPAAPDEPLI